MLLGILRFFKISLLTEKRIMPLSLPYNTTAENHISNLSQQLLLNERGKSNKYILKVNKSASMEARPVS